MTYDEIHEMLADEMGLKPVRLDSRERCAYFLGNVTRGPSTTRILRVHSLSNVVTEVKRSVSSLSGRNVYVDLPLTHEKLRAAVVDEVQEYHRRQ
jgi:hypothetical protein